jgi:hypothetical protein
MFPSKISRVNADQLLLTGITKYLGDGPVLIDGKKYAASDIVSIVKERVDAEASVTATKAAHQSAVIAEKAVQAKTKVFVASLRQALKIMFKSSVDALTELGLARVPRGPKVETKASAHVKALATREARHTMGARQRMRIHGAVSPPPAKPPEGPTPPTGGGATHPTEANNASH